MFSRWAGWGDWWRRLREPEIERNLRPYRSRLAAVRAREQQLTALDGAALRQRAHNLTARARAGETPRELLVETFALVLRAAQTTLHQRAFDEQILAALAMHRGRVVELQTGEGKTLAAVFVACIEALSGQGVHVLTANDYLARRDANWMGPVYRLLGLSVGCSREGLDPRGKHDAYAADVTYVTAREAGFDFLRDGLAMHPEDLTHRQTFHAAIIDEADSILIDEARIPLVIAGSANSMDQHARKAEEIVRQLDPSAHLATDENARSVHLTEAGIDRVEQLLGTDNLYGDGHAAINSALGHALHAHTLLHRNVDYIVRDGRLEVVDEFTGRVAEQRQWPDGLQAALAAKEQLPPPREGFTLGSIPLHHYVQLYTRLCGMTGTAQPAARELWQSHDLKVLVIPPHRPCLRRDESDLIFTDREARQRALVRRIAQVHASGRPMLVGTASIEESEQLAARLDEAGLPCQVLNARQDEHEAAIISQAGALGALTISTNMAGRGTDIRLGGSDEHDRERVVRLGGLCIFGTRRHESRRIDDQLRGRAGRQGDPGSSCFFLSLADELMQRFGLSRLLPQEISARLDGEIVTDRRVQRELHRAQRIAEGQNREIRRQLFRYTKVLEDQRRILGAWRRNVLHGRGSSLLRKRAGPRHAELCTRVGRAAVEECERLITLHQIDRGWSRQLDRAAHTRDGIHLVSAANLDPLTVFHQTLVSAFADLRDEIEQAIIESFLALEVRDGALDLEAAELTGPSATWTYLITDNPFGTPFDRMMNRMANLVRRAVRGDRPAGTPSSG